MSKELTVVGTNDFMLESMLNEGTFNQMQRAATLFSKSGLVPQTFKDNPAACFVGLQLSAQLGVSPFMLFQKLYTIGNKIGIEAQMAIGIANNKGVFKGGIKYTFEGEGKTRKCTASAVLASSGEAVEMSLNWDTVEKSGWSKRAGSQWLTMPDLMFRYRTAMWLIRVHAPEVLLGLQSVDEIHDVIDITPRKTIGEAFAELEVKAEPVEEAQPEEKTEAKPEPKSVAGAAEPKPKATPKTAQKTEPKPEAKPETTPKSNEDLQKLLDEIDSYKIGVITAYVVRATGTNKKREDWTAEDAAKILEEIKRMKAGK